MTRIRPLVTIAFIVLACGLAWLVALPLWLGNALADPYAGLLLPVMMYTPAIAVLIVLLSMKPVAKGERLRFLGMWPLRPAKRVIWMSVVGLFGPIVVVVAALLLAVAFGWFTADFAGLSGFEQLLRQSVPAGTPLPAPWIILAAQLATIPIAAATINALSAPRAGSPAAS